MLPLERLRALVRYIVERRRQTRTTSKEHERREHRRIRQHLDHIGRDIDADDLQRCGDRQASTEEEAAGQDPERTPPRQRAIVTWNVPGSSGMRVDFIRSYSASS